MQMEKILVATAFDNFERYDNQAICDYNLYIVRRNTLIDIPIKYKLYLTNELNLVTGFTLNKLWFNIKSLVI